MKNIAKLLGTLPLGKIWDLVIDLALPQIEKRIQRRVGARVQDSELVEVATKAIRLVVVDWPAMYGPILQTESRREEAAQTAEQFGEALAAEIRSRPVVNRPS